MKILVTLAYINIVEKIIGILENKQLFINESKLIKVARYYEEMVI